MGHRERRDFETRPAFAKAALGWLKANYPNYSAVEIEAENAIDSFAGFHYRRETIDVELDAGGNVPENADVRDAEGEAGGRNTTDREADVFAQGRLSDGDCFFGARRKATGRGSLRSVGSLLPDRCDGAATQHV